MSSAFLIASVCLANVAPVTPGPWLPETEIYHTPSGPFLLTPDPETYAFEAGADALRELRRELSGLITEPLYGPRQHRVVEVDERGALERALVRRGLRRLAVYRLAGGARLFSDGGVMMRFAPLADLSAIDGAARSGGADGLRVVDRRRGFARLQVAPASAAALASALHRRPDVVWAQPDFIYRIESRVAPNDPLYAQQWHHALIQAEPAWDRELGESSVRIAVIDSGVDVAHPDLVAGLVAPRDTENLDDDPSPEPGEAHGTACAGIAAASSNNALGVAGVCQRCSVIPIRLFSGSGFTRTGADSDAFYWAIDNGAAVISNSWGPAGEVPVPFSLDEAITEAATLSRGGLGALILFASGNTGSENQSFELESHPLVLAVGATGLDDRREPYSNFGPDLDLMAPAAAVTTDNRGTDGYVAGDYMVSFGGTSAATPVVAGVAGLLLSFDSSLDRGQLTDALLSTADRIGDEPYTDARNDLYGFGRVNAARALERVATGEVCMPTVEDCGNGVDDDCDFLVDSDDPSCAPATGELCGGPGGECQRGNVCLPEDPSGAIYRCFETCLRDGDCDTEPCVPISNDLSVCMAEDGVACPTCGALTCDASSLCVTYSELALSLCTPPCSSSDECPLGFFCSPVGGGQNACAPLSFSCSAFGPTAGAPCGVQDSCALGHVCLSDGRCYRVCDGDGDCPEAQACTVTQTPGIRYCDCACDTTAACEVGCACDTTCRGSCQCDETSACDPGCPCDGDCETCACDRSPSCDTSCGCDPSCPEPANDDENADPGGCRALSGLLLALLPARVSRQRRRREKPINDERD